jgi:predicted AAA+ superfamily ATPase
MTDPFRSSPDSFARAEQFLARIETASACLHQPPLDWKSGPCLPLAQAAPMARGWLQAVRNPHPIRLADLNNIDDQKTRVTPTLASSSPVNRPTTCC